MDKSAASEQPGLLGALAGVARNTLALLLSRVELAAVELSEARAHLLRLIVVWTLAVLALLCGALYASATLAFLGWDALGWKVLPLIAGGFLAVAVALALYARALLRQDKLGLPATMAELKADREMLL